MLLYITDFNLVWCICTGQSKHALRMILIINSLNKEFPYRMGLIGGGGQ